MNIQQMRNIDTYAGGVACLILEAVEGIKRLFFTKAAKKPGTIKKILITKYLGMGSILLATAMLRALRLRFPDSKIVFLTFDSNARFVKQIHLIDEVVSIKTSSFSVFAIDLLNALIKIRQEKFDVVFDLEFFARFSTIVSYLSRTKVRVGYYLPKLWRGKLLTHQVHFNPHKHITEVFAAQLKTLDIDVTDLSLIPPTVKEDKIQGVNTLLKEKGIGESEKIVAVNVNATDLSMERRWPKESFIDLITYITKNKEEAKIVLVGSKGEAGYVKSVYDALPEESRGRVIDLSGALDIEEFIALLKQSTLFITNDSGPLHIAASLGTLTVSFFGPESPLLYGPLGNHNTFFYRGIYCSPCLNVYNAKTAMCKGDNQCMKEIKPTYVIDTLVKKGIL
ncbi:glycosyltransferase family 9 protein [Candidatus Parcubacteria bacterium]|jgi:ADP-heptose:LPS heptosyltransferase|nr:MAG: glycosyltransferase family 9 protein [Candidatus Parcubacteria bacterium]